MVGLWQARCIRESVAWVVLLRVEQLELLGADHQHDKNAHVACAVA